MTASTMAPLEALRRLIAEVKQLDAVEVGARWNQLQGELGVAEGVAREPVFEEELVKVKRDVEEGLGYGFMVDGLRVGMDRIVWYNRPGETALHARGLPCPDEGNILDEFNTWFGPVAADSNAHNMAIQFWAQEAYRAGRLGLANEYTTPTAAVSAAPSGEVEEQLRGEGWLRAMSDVSALLPNSYYMDPPDGGSVTVLEQVERMAKDAERYRYIRNTGTLDTLVWLALEGDGLVNDAGELDEEGYQRGLDRAVDISIKDAAKVAALSPDAATTKE